MSILSSLLKKPQALLEDKIATAKEQVQNEVSGAIAKLLIVLPILIFIILALIIISVGVALLINHKLDHNYAGYLWVGAFYLIMAVFLLLIGKSEGAKRLLKQWSDKMVFDNEE